MKILRETLEVMKKGFAHSHVGDYLTGSEKLKAIADVDASASAQRNLLAQQTKEAAKTKTKRQSIAMYLGSELPAHLMDYMIETCISLDHDLKVLTFESSNVSQELLEPYQAVLAEKNITMQKTKLTGNPMAELNRHLKGHPEIVFLACRDSGFIGRSYLSGNPAKINLSVPVVVVSEDNATNTMSLDNTDNVTQLKAANQ